MNLARYLLKHAYLIEHEAALFAKHLREQLDCVAKSFGRKPRLMELIDHEGVRDCPSMAEQFGR